MLFEQDFYKKRVKAFWNWKLKKIISWIGISTFQLWNSAANIPSLIQRMTDKNQEKQEKSQWHPQPHTQSLTATIQQGKTLSSNRGVMKTTKINYNLHLGHLQINQQKDKKKLKKLSWVILLGWESDEGRPLFPQTFGSEIQAE